MRKGSRRALRRYRKFVVFRNKSTRACSCEICRSPRRCSWNSLREKLTVQERRAEDSYWDEVEDVG